LTETTRAVVLAAIGVASAEEFDAHHFTLIENDPLAPPIEARARPRQ